MPHIEIHLTREMVEILGAEKPAEVSLKAFVETLLGQGLNELQREEKSRRPALSIVKLNGDYDDEE